MYYRRSYRNVQSAGNARKRGPQDRIHGAVLCIDLASLAQVKPCKSTTMPCCHTWLQISVQDFGRMDVFESAQHLINEILVMLIGEFLFGSNDLMKVGVHQLRYEIYVVELFRAGAKQVLKSSAR